MPVIPELWEAEVGGSLEARSLRPTWVTWQNPVSTKNTKVSQAWWHMPVILAIQKAEAGESLEPQAGEVAVSRDHFSALQPGQQSKTPSQTKQNIKTKTKMKPQSDIKEAPKFPSGKNSAREHAQEKPLTVLQYFPIYNVCILPPSPSPIGCLLNLQ